MKKFENIINYLKAFGTGFLLIWLFVKSPLNPLYDDFTKTEMSFVYVSFISWVILSVFLFWILFFVNKSNFEKHLSKILFFAVSVYFIFLIPYGFDTTDTGFHLSKQWFMFHGLWKENFDVIAGTNFFGGLWLLIPGQPMVIWARLGFVLVQAGIALFSFKILALYFEPLKTFFLVLALTIFISPWNYYFTVNYDNFPLLLMLSAFYLIFSALKDPVAKNFGISIFISGVIITFSIFSKLTLIPIFFIIIYLLFINKSLKKEKINGKNINIFLYGFISGLLLILAIILLTGAFSSYFEFFRVSIADFTSEKTGLQKVQALQDHSLFALYDKYTSVIMQILSFSYVTFFFLLFSGYVIAGSQKLSKYIRLLIYIIVGWVLYYRLFGDSNIKENMLVELFVISTLSFALSMYVIWLLCSENKRIKENILPIIGIPALFMMSFAGSDLGFSTAFRSGAGTILIAYAVLLVSKAEWTFNKVIIKFGFIYYFVIIGFFIGFLNSSYTFYRDLKYSELKTDFRTTSLFGIKSNKARTIVVDELFDYLGQIDGLPNKKILFTHNNAMMYYLAGVKYPMLSPWDVINDLEKIRMDFAVKKPDLIIVAKTTHQESTWPYTNNSMDDTRYKPYYEFYEVFIKENGFTETYKNYFYTVYETK